MRINIKERLSRNLESEIIEFESKIKKLRENIDNYKKKSNYDQYTKIYEKVEEINEELIKSLKDSYEFEDRCRFLEFDARMPPTKEIISAKEEFTPYVNLWKYIHDFNKFKSDVIDVLELKSLQKEGVDNKFKEIFSKFVKIKKDFEKYAEENEGEMSILKTTDKFYEVLKDFQTKFVPLINYLGNEAIEDEHWAEISRITNITISKGEEP